MTEGYWCDKCGKFVAPESGVFQHPDVGRATCLLCPRHDCMVYLKEDKTKELV